MERLSDYLRYYLVFSPIEQALSSEEFTVLLEARLDEARKELLTRVHPMDQVTHSPTAASNEVE
jgi:hypothetical protein